MITASKYIGTYHINAITTFSSAESFLYNLYTIDCTWSKHVLHTHANYRGNVTVVSGQTEDNYDHIDMLWHTTKYLYSKKRPPKIPN